MKWLNTILASLLTLHMTVTVADNLEFSSPEKQATLLELFTSEGCSSCPPAEHWVNQLIDNEQLWNTIIPVVFHVDYWDYIGWNDRYASPDYSKRQRQYYKERAVSSVYTPGMFQNGKEWRGWWRSKPLPQSQNNVGILSAQLQDQLLKVQFANKTESALDLNVAILGFGLKTHVQAGENEGKTLEHEFVVLGKSKLASNNGRWSVKLPASLSVPAQRKAIAIWVSKEGQQQPIQAAGAWLRKT